MPKSKLTPREIRRLYFSLEKKEKRARQEACQAQAKQLIGTYWTRRESWGDPPTNWIVFFKVIGADSLSSTYGTNFKVLEVFTAVNRGLHEVVCREDTVFCSTPTPPMAWVKSTEQEFRTGFEHVVKSILTLGECTLEIVPEPTRLKCSKSPEKNS